MPTPGIRPASTRPSNPCSPCRSRWKTATQPRRGSVAGSGGGVADVAALLRDAGLLVADPGEGGDALADLLLGGQAEAEPQPRLRGGAVDRPFRTRIEGDAGLQRRLHQ